MKTRFVIFGATGDLTFRYLVPALAQLYEARSLPGPIAVLGVAREPWDTATFRSRLWEKLNQAGLAEPSHRELLKMFEYRQADVQDPAQILRALDDVGEPAVFYLALPPRLFAPVLDSLARLKVADASAIVLEKPFGEDLPSARALNRQLHGKFAEGMIFRIDSFLGEQTVHNIMGLRFGNVVFESLWNSRHMEKVEILWDETLTLEGRAAYYDRAGALKDMIQNHLLQLLCVVAMEPPQSMAERDVRQKRLEVLRAVRTPSAGEVARGSVRGRYGEGFIGSRKVPAYRHEPGVDPARGTETFAQTTVWIDNWRWAGVPFVLRTGKALAEDRMEIKIQFKSVPHHPFATVPPPPNMLRLKMNPDRIELGVNISGPCQSCSLHRVELATGLPEQDLSPYGRLLLDVMARRQTFFISGDEAEESWRIVEPVARCWSQGEVPLVEYPAGSSGPELPP